MRKRQWAGAALFCLLVSACGEDAPPESHASLQYPDTATVDQIDDYHGTEVPDPYRWLEDDVRESEAVRDWVEKQNQVTFSYLEKIPERDAIKARLTELWDYEKYGLPYKYGERYFYRYNDGLQNQSVLMVQDGPEAEPRLLVDPNEWAEDDTVALAAFYPSRDGKYVALMVQDAGSDWRIARVLDVDSGETLPDELEWLKFTEISWNGDGSGFFYSRYPAIEEGEKFQSLNENMKVWFHRLGTPQDEDVIVYEAPDHPEWRPGAAVTDDGRYLVITISVGTDDRYQIAYKDLAEEDAEVRTLIEGFEHDYSLIGNVGDELYFRTNDEAPRNRVIAIDVDNAERDNWREIIPESDDVLNGVSLVGGHIIAEYMQDAKSAVRVFDFEGRQTGAVELPGIGTAYGFQGYLDDPETFFAFESFNTPTRIYRYDVETGGKTVFREPDVVFDPEDYVTEQVFYESRDGTRVPMFISRRRDVTPDGRVPTVLYGYGGFNISERPDFSTTVLGWMEMGGIFAVANLRGGGEYGEEWHQAGTKLNKQNVFDDFIAAAEYLVEEGYTSREKLAIFGGSNGGLLVGAVLNQRPELFAAAIPAVGVMDMLRFHKFTAGRFWTDDYGSSDNAEEFEALYAYSPYHNIQKGAEYPAVLVTTADTDDRVVPGHSFKYAAAMQEAQAGEDPVLIRIETRAGHGSGKPTDKIIQDYADRWAFLVENLDMRLPEDYGGSQGVTAVP